MSGLDAQGSSRVLVVDDEAQIRRLMTVSLSSRSYHVDAVDTAERAMDRLAVEPYDIVLLDLGLPDMDGAALCKAIREWSGVPIIVISVRDGERDKVAALDAGADDYVTKPFGIDELLARMRANLRRVPSATDEPAIVLGPLCLDLVKRRVMVRGDEVHLTPTEYDLFRVLTLHAGRVMTHRTLLREARGPAYEDDVASLRVHVAALRQKLAVESGSPGYIATEPGVGYRLLT